MFPRTMRSMWAGVFLSLSPTPILLHTGEEARPARRLGLVAQQRSFALGKRVPDGTGHERLTGPFPKLEKPPTPRRSPNVVGLLVEVVARRLFCKSR